MAKKKRIDWRAEFEHLLAPRILKALKDDRAGITPLRAAHRKACAAMLGISMSAAQLKSALATVRRPKAKPKRRRAAA
jgi:hypothetical protein